MRTAKFDFKPRPSYVSMERPKPSEPVPAGIVIQQITHVPEPVEPWLVHLRELRRVLSQADIAKATGLSSGHISRYVNRSQNPGTANQIKIRRLWEDVCC